MNAERVPPFTSDKGGIDETSRSGFRVPPFTSDK
jgi:hypothetical protein